MTGEASVEVDIADVIRGFHAVKINVHKAVQKLISRIAFKGEDFMKKPGVAPYRTGTLRRSIYAIPRINPINVSSQMEGMEINGVPVAVNYAFAANKYSRSPRFIERTVEHMNKIVQQEANIVIKNALKGMNR